MTKTQKIIKEMLDNNQRVFESFEKVHSLYLKEPGKYKHQFNDEGQDVLDIIRRYENRLCGNSEKGGYSRFSPNLAEKFWLEIRKMFPKIDEVGLA